MHRTPKPTRPPMTPAKISSIGRVGAAPADKDRPDELVHRRSDDRENQQHGRPQRIARIIHLDHGRKHAGDRLTARNVLPEQARASPSGGVVPFSHPSTASRPRRVGSSQEETDHLFSGALRCILVFLRGIFDRRAFGPGGIFFCPSGHSHAAGAARRRQLFVQPEELTHRPPRPARC